ISGGLHELQFLHEDCSFREDTRFLVDIVRTRLDVYVMKFREICLGLVQKIGRCWRTNINPFVKVLWQNKVAIFRVFRKIAAGGVPIVGWWKLWLLCEHCGCHSASAEDGGKCQYCASHDLSPLTSCMSPNEVMTAFVRRWSH